ncbi:polysaccharide pyruvyl transferase family protein [Ichthyenterobacterium magnum]|uniref:Polysaccharide pyruvyl transferase n=1 Tax=Ichthyenterobacterium magnum TaxID=1230530 RepID=A0A420DUX4_9FLAO|nr:polysaccharide pyruvyl transferase family protein [Ichthyenterobacterium magnum]RKE97979.1 polysaccharide pyruvyl transferase [Ichthyenterobacterium magnum]
MFRLKSIRLFWWSEPLLMGKPKENYGDLLGKYLVEKISHTKVKFTHPKKPSFKNLFAPIYVTIGSILAHVNKNCIVWGSGIINEDQLVKPAKFLAVRGPETRRVLMRQGYDVPEIFGDPALLLPDYYLPKVNKVHKLGVIPHYVDYARVVELFKDHKAIVVIDLMTNDVELTTKQIMECERIVSSSLHGVIVSHAYGIPAVWVKFSDRLFGDDIKFKDYFKSVLIPPYKFDYIEKDESLEAFFNPKIELPNPKQINKLKLDLMSVCPFK